MAVGTRRKTKRKSDDARGGAGFALHTSTSSMSRGWQRGATAYGNISYAVLIFMLCPFDLSNGNLNVAIDGSVEPMKWVSMLIERMETQGAKSKVRANRDKCKGSICGR